MSTADAENFNNESLDGLESLVNSMAKSIQDMTERHMVASLLLQQKISADKNGLMSAYGYKTLTPEQKRRICNGAGAAGEWVSSFIPNTMYGLDCTEVFNIHDFDYHTGRSFADKHNADNRMLKNLLIVINHTGGLLQWVRRRRAMKYYESVHHGGDEAFLTRDSL